MATSGKIQGTTKNDSGSNITTKYGTWIDWNVNSTDIAKNTSNITIKVSVQRVDDYTGVTAYNLETKPSVTLTVGGSAKSPTISYIDTRNKKKSTFATWTGNVSHKDDGSLSLSLSCSWSLSGVESLASGSISGTAKLNDIPRATTPTLSTTSVVANGSNSITINIKPASSTFKHKIRYYFGSVAKSTIGLSIGGDFTAQGNTTVTFIPPVSLCNEIPNSKTGKGAIYCYTYKSDGTHIGTETVEFSITVPTYSITPKVITSGNNLLNGFFVQGKSTLNVEINAGTSYGASITSYSTVLDGKTYTTPKFTSEVLSNGFKTAAVTVKDSRGVSATVNSTGYTVYAYSTPLITSFTAERQSDGTTVLATVKGSVAAVSNGNTKTVTITLNGETKTISSGYTVNGSATFTNVPTDNTLTATATIADSYTSVSKEAVIPTVDVTMDFHHSGKGVAFGKVAEEENLLDIDWDVRIKGNPLTDFEFYRGTSDGWTVKKYISGEIDAYKSVSVNTTVSSTYGNGFYNGSTLSVNLPTDFVNNAFPVININAQSTQAQILDANIAAYNQAERKISYYITSPAKQATSYQVWVHFRVVGRWK